MAQDFDFKRSVIRRPAPAVAKPAAKKAPWFLLVAVLGLALVGGALFMQANQTPTETTQTSQPPENPENPAIAATEVQVFDGGSGEAAAATLVGVMLESNINARYAGKTLSIYETTEIWYDEGYSELATKVAAALSDKSPKLTQSKVQGVFTVQVFVGKK